MSCKSQTLTTIGDKFNAPQYFSSGASGKVQLGLDRWRGIVRKSDWAGYLKYPSGHIVLCKKPQKVFKFFYIYLWNDQYYLYRCCTLFDIWFG